MSRSPGPEEGWVAGDRTVTRGGVIFHTGDGGANYRYRVVPIDYTSKGMLSAPGMLVKP